MLVPLRRSREAEPQGLCVPWQEPGNELETPMIFVDTGYLFALLNPRDDGASQLLQPIHEKATLPPGVTRQFRGKMSVPAVRKREKDRSDGPVNV